MTKTLPLDILLSEILHKLPVTTIIRFKCLSKSMNSWISSDEFVNLHLRHPHPSDLDSHLLMVTSSSPRNISFYTMDLNSTTLVAKKLPFGIDKLRLHMLSFVGCSGGLHCFLIYKSSKSRLMLFNPSTLMFKQFPCKIVKNLNQRDNRLTIHKAAVMRHFGFVFDNVNDDYKIVIVELFDNATTEVMVYSFKTNLTRRVGPGRRLYAWSGTGGNYYSCDATIIDNHLLHWIGIGKSIKCFDVHNEQWKNNDLWPQGEDLTYNALLRCFDRRLCLLAAANIWIMEEYSVKESWVKVFNMSDYIELPRPNPLCYIKASKYEILVWRVARWSSLNKFANIDWLDLMNNKIAKKAKIHGILSAHMFYSFGRNLAPIPGLAGQLRKGKSTARID